jgi:hypothetical protein
MPGPQGARIGGKTSMPSSSDAGLASGRAAASGGKLEEQSKRNVKY